MSQPKKLAVVGGCVIFLCLSISVIAAYYVQRLGLMLKDENYSYLEEMAQQQAKSLNNRLEGDIRMLQAMAAILGNEQPIDVDRWVSAMGSAPVFSQFQRIGLILPDGRGYGQDVSGVDFSDRIYFQQAMRGASYISDALIDRVTGLFSYTYAVPVYHKGEIVCVLAAVTNMDVLQAILFDKPFLGTGYTYLIQHDGKVVLRSKGSAEIQNLFQCLELTQEQQTQMTVQMDTGASGSLDCQMQGQNLFMSFTPLGVNNWYVMSVLSDQVVRTRGNQILTLTAISTSIACGIAMVIVCTFFVMQTRSRDRLYRLAYFDSLTGMGNKRWFQRQTQKLLLDRRTQYAYCILNIKRFQMVNDRFGYPEGDKLLCHAARILERETGGAEASARFTADYFHVLFKMDSQQALTERLLHIADEIGAYPFPGEREYALFVGFGIYEVEQDIDSVDVMGDMAKMAMERLRDQFRNTCGFFSDSLQNQVREAREIENTMYRALKNNEFQLYLQPQYRLDGETLAGAEALVRWQHPTKGLIPPDRFIPLFEKNGFITEIDLYMFQTTCDMLQRWQKGGHKVVPISINQSRVNLCTPGYLDKLISIFREHDLHPEWLKIEITESAFMDESDAMDAVVTCLQQVGFVVSMDDFGSGYSTLNMLQSIPLDELKLDKNFLRDSSNSDRGRKIVENVISMATDLNIEVVSEGVETAEQAAFLRKIGCQIVQGYYYARPMPWREFEELAGMKESKPV